MKNRMAALLTCGFMSFFVLGAAGAASDMYFETGRRPDGVRIRCYGFSGMFRASGVDYVSSTENGNVIVSRSSARGLIACFKALDRAGRAAPIPRFDLAAPGWLFVYQDRTSPPQLGWSHRRPRFLDLASYATRNGFCR